MTEYSRMVIIPKEDAVFWLDKDGRWRNDGGRFRNKKIIDHFHASISKDSSGYFVSQQRENLLEKVYFRYEDTALFVFDVLRDSEIILVLNTRKQMNLIPDALYVHQDNLYLTVGDETIKFGESALIKISDLIEEKKGRLFITVNGDEYKINEK